MAQPITRIMHFGRCIRLELFCYFHGYSGKDFDYGRNRQPSAVNFENGKT
jgi:hypothetical protein